MCTLHYSLALQKFTTKCCPTCVYCICVCVWLYTHILIPLIFSIQQDCDHVSQTAEEFYTVRCQVADMKNIYVRTTSPSTLLTSFRSATKCYRLGFYLPITRLKSHSTVVSHCRLLFSLEFLLLQMATSPQVILCRTLLVRCIFYAPNSSGHIVLLGMLLETCLRVSSGISGRGDHQGHSGGGQHVHLLPVWQESTRREEVSCREPHEEDPAGFY